MLISGISCLTPIDDTHTELSHTSYWIIPGVATIARPIISYFVKAFLTQDKDMAELQEQRLKYKPPLLMTIPDAGTPGRWYFQLKKEGLMLIRKVGHLRIRWGMHSSMAELG
jgi:hypothetical protein